MVIDGKAKFGTDLAGFYRQPSVVSQVARLGLMVTPMTRVSDEAPAHAEINVLDRVSRWIVVCPNCRTGAAYVWLDDPITFCVNCGNDDIDHAWRRVILPRERLAIEASLEMRPDPDMRNWTPGETLETVRRLTAVARGETETEAP